MADDRVDVGISRTPSSVSSSAAFDATSAGGSPARRPVIRRYRRAVHPVDRVEHLKTDKPLP